jgi:hypothetical protein
MSDRIITHSSRYKGPMGDSRPPAQIFAEIEARTKQAEQYKAKLISVLDDIKQNMTLTSLEERTRMIRATVIEWLATNCPDFINN